MKLMLALATIAALSYASRASSEDRFVGLGPFNAPILNGSGEVLCYGQDTEIHLEIDGLGYAHNLEVPKLTNKYIYNRLQGPQWVLTHEKINGEHIIYIRSAVGILIAVRYGFGDDPNGEKQAFFASSPDLRSGYFLRFPNPIEQKLDIICKITIN